ncbi:hypothetical protein HRI_004023100 [Hibiscus trionum]|uniref:CCHC-type domain-containing protein n=1 Tax=Hibiscus trionum TaxID=183268 RepID=A0A9W7J150_HIBTR|nr:hypothetical protein HRI_004023100 [Hibiscus trionum]
MTDLHAVGGMRKLNNDNYNTCEKEQPEAEDANGVLRKWKIKAGKAMYALKTTVEEDMLEHIRDVKSPNEAWETFAKLFSKKTDTKLQLLETAPISDTRMKRIIFHGLKPEFRSFVAAVQGWQTQPSLVEFENLLANQEALAKQMGEVSLKNEEETLYASKGKRNFKQRNNGGFNRNQGEGSSREGGGSKNHKNNKKFEGKCYNCGKKGYIAISCWSKKNYVESNVVTSNSEEEWDAEAFFTVEEEDDKEKLQNLSEYKGSHVLVTTNKSKLPIAHVGNTMVSPQNNDTEMPL